MFEKLVLCGFIMSCLAPQILGSASLVGLYGMYKVFTNQTEKPFSDAALVWCILLGTPFGYLIYHIFVATSLLAAENTWNTCP